MNIEIKKGVRMGESRYNMKKMIINGVKFKVKKSGSITFYQSYFFRDLTDCYKKPSDEKKAIWNKWKKFFNELESFSDGCFVNSYCDQFFTIGNVVRINGIIYNVLITPTHNYIAEHIIVDLTGYTGRKRYKNV